MKSAVIIFPGSNRDHDMIRAIETVAGQTPVSVWHEERELPAVDFIAIPGGFTYGDYLRAGAIAARAPVMDAIARQASAGVPVLGVCNGFQILCEAGLLPGVLMRNASQQFICRDAWLRVETADSVFTSGYRAGETIRCPVAHGEGNYRCDSATLAALTAADRIAFRYATAEGDTGPAANLNGSVEGIAGILSEKRNVLGMMPHPENLVEALHGGTDGRGVFQSLTRSAMEMTA